VPAVLLAPGKATADPAAEMADSADRTSGWQCGLDDGPRRG